MIRLFQVYVPASVLGVLVGDLAILLACYTLPALATDLAAEIYLFDEGGLARSAFVVFCIALGLHYNDLYSNLRIRWRSLLLQQICVAIGVAFLVQAVLIYIYPPGILPRGLMFIGSALALFSLLAWRIAYSRLIRGFGVQRLLFLGNSEAVVEIVRRLNAHPEWGLRPLGYLADEAPAEDSGHQGFRHLGAIGEIREVVAAHNPDRLVVGMAERRRRMPVDQLVALRFSGVRVEEAAALYEMALGRICLASLRPSSLIFASELGPRRGKLLAQAVYSALIAVAAFVVAIPVMLAAAAAIKLTSRGPVLYRQTRVGLNGAPFVLYKFRSMRADAESVSGAVWAQEDDPRITPVGRWLRRLRLDELPQLFNVLKGEMSIVGPRPERPEFVRTLEQQIPFYRQRHSVRPGITGWAQINHKYGNTLEDAVIKLEYDLYYIKNLTVSLDFVIMFQTAKIMLLWRGAH